MDKRNFLKTLGLAAGMLPFLGMNSAFSTAQTAPRLLPKPLKKGDLVGIVSPSAAMADEMQFLFAREAMEALGFNVVLGTHVANRRGHLAGTDAERAKDLNDMFAHQQVKAIICLRGGSGAARVLPLIDYENIKRNPKPLLGYSDITALHNAIYAQTGLVTFHGPNGSGSWNSFNVNQFQKMFFAQELRSEEHTSELQSRENLVCRLLLE